MLTGTERVVLSHFIAEETESQKARGLPKFPILHNGIGFELSKNFTLCKGHLHNCLYF